MTFQMRPWERNAANLAASLGFYGETVSLGGVRLITARVAFPVFNIALLDAPVSGVDGELERRLDLAQGHYTRQNRKWSFWFCEHLLGSISVGRLDRVCERRGLHPIADSPGMEVDALPAPRRHLPHLEFRRVEDAETRAAFSSIVTQCFHIPPDIARLVYEYEPAWRSPLRVWLAYDGGLAVSSTAAIVAGGGLGLYSIATLPGLRGHGFAEAAMRYALDELRATGATGPVVLQSSPAGLELYRRLGFRKVTRYFVYAME
jgi:ribosomal protein S18 acetylase RimI-like enzyme